LLTAAEGGDDTAISILERGEHRLPFDFALPEQCLPCSFESRVGTVRYYLRVIIDIPYASPPQGLKYFTVIGPHIDSNDDKYAVSTAAAWWLVNARESDGSIVFSIVTKSFFC